jgi:hypothetical protein
MPESATFRVLWLASGRSRGDFEAMVQAYDPVSYAAGLRRKHVLMLAANIDEVIPPRAAVALWQAAGRPPLVWFDCGHYSAVGYLMPGIRRAAEFLAAP